MALSVLVVDDDPVILRLLQVNFELEGIGVVTAVDGEEGLKMAQTDPPDLVISDIMMPKVNGLELGADDYITKPFDPLELIDRVYKVLAKSRR